MITLLVLTDGRRHCLEPTLESFHTHIDRDLVTRRIIVNDCPDPTFRDWVETLGFDLHLAPLAQRRGFAGAIAAGWEAAGSADWLFHLEDDFLFHRRVDLHAMASVLSANPHLAQMALRRQPWNEAETAAGGIVEQRPETYVDCTDGSHYWLEHRNFFTTNPSLYPSWVRDRGWPICSHSEGIFSIQLFANRDIHAGFWGKRTDDPWVQHIGTCRTGTGY